MRQDNSIIIDCLFFFPVNISDNNTRIINELIFDVDYLMSTTDVLYFITGI